jgi:hypothetical protein
MDLGLQLTDSRTGSALWAARAKRVSSPGRFRRQCRSSALASRRDTSFSSVALAFVALIRRIRIPIPRWAELFPLYAMGSVVMFWVVQRIAAF